MTGGGRAASPPELIDVVPTPAARRQAVDAMKYTMTSFASRATSTFAPRSHSLASHGLVLSASVGAAGRRCRGRDKRVGARERAGDVIQLHTSGRRLLASSPS